MSATPQTTTTSIVTFQGEPGAYANLATREALPHALALPRTTFEDALLAVREGEADLTIIPVENSLHGRIADIHHLLPEAGLHITGEHFHRVRHQLLGTKGATLSSVTTVFSQEPALGQCRKLIRERKLVARSWHDTAGAARHVAELGDPSVAAIASSLAAELYGLDILAPDIEDEPHNVTRFLILAREPRELAPEAGPVITTFVFRV
jgi:prephenate dehydratase